MVLSVEKSQIQALDRTQPGLPLKKAVRMNHENDPVQDIRRTPEPTLLSGCLTRRANQQHNFIIAKAVETTAGAQRNSSESHGSQ